MFEFPTAARRGAASSRFRISLNVENFFDAVPTYFSWMRAMKYWKPGFGGWGPVLCEAATRSFALGMI